MKEKKDWNNFPSLLIGLEDAKHPFRSQLERFTRMAGLAGHPEIIVECARRVSDTGFTLGDLAVVAELMWQLQHKAARSDWAEIETQQALSRAEAVAELLEDKRHAGGSIRDPSNDPRIRPEVIGVLLQLSAVSAIRWNSGADKDGKVAQYVQRLLHAPARPQPADTMTSKVFYVTFMAPALHGLKLAESILGEVEGLASYTAEIESTLEEQKQILMDRSSQPKKSGSYRWLITYNELLGPDAKRVVSGSTKDNGEVVE